jgi:hypothetical protein
MVLPTDPTVSDLAKAVILVLDGRGRVRRPVPVRFNPSEYNLERRVQYGEQALPGLSTPLTQFVNGTGETLTMELFVDTYDEKLDVRVFTKLIDSLVDVDPELHRPPVCRFVWGTLNFKCVVESVGKRFTMFLPGGIPVRARLNVTFKRYQTPLEQRLAEQRRSADKTRLRRAKVGDSLWSIAAEVYGDPGEWRRIAEANGIVDPRTLEPGRELLVPTVEA